MAITDIKARTAKVKDKPYKISDGDGLFLLVTPTGGKWWRFKYRFGGKEKLLSLGTYPEVSLAGARERQKLHGNRLRPALTPAKYARHRKRRRLPVAKTLLKWLPLNGTASLCPHGQKFMPTRSWTDCQKKFSPGLDTGLLTKSKYRSC